MSCDYFSRTGLKYFIDTGCILEYPDGIMRPVPVSMRIELLQFIKREIEKKIEKEEKPSSAEHENFRFHILKENMFYMNNEISFCASKKSVITFPLGMADMHLCIIKEPQIVAVVRKFMEEYLPNSDMVYPDKKALEIIQEGIESLVRNL